MNKKVYVGKYINKHLKKIGKKLNLPINLTTKIARDSYATSLKNSNVSISIIAEKLGHSNTSVTQHYLGSFDDDEMMKINELLP
jgi:integrase